MATLNFKGKAFVQNHHLLVKYHQLVPRKEKSLTEKVSLHDNLIIHGDNLKALKALLPTYAGKIKCIYIDPPYNTGNERWVYNDNVNSSMIQDWLGKVVDKEDLTRHDKWLCMMTPRLKLLRELLSEDGFICVSIGDEEVHHLRSLMDEVFNEDNFRNTVSIRRFDKNISRQFFEKGLPTLTIGFENILIYSRTKDSSLNPVFREASIERQNFGYWKGFWNCADRPTMRYELLGVKPETGQWKWKKEVAFEAVENYKEYQKKFENKMTLEEYWEKTGGKKKFIKRRTDLQTGKNKGVEHWISPSEGVLISSNWYDLLASETLKNLKLTFDNPKNINVIKRVIELSTDENSIILDSFAGSGTTAHAVLALNKDDGGNRSFILVECEDYADKITAERVRRVIKGQKKTKGKNLKQGLGGSFSYFELGPPIEMESILTGDKLPTYKELARYVFYTSTGEEFVEKAVNEKKNFIGESSKYLVYLFYKPDMDYLKATALTLDRAKALGPYKNKRRLVFAPTKYLDQEHLDELRIDFAQLPFEIYQLVK